MKKIMSIAIALLFLVGIGFSQDQTHDNMNYKTNFQVSIAELEEKIKNVYEDILEKISKMKKQTNDQITFSLTQYSTFQKELEHRYDNLSNEFSERDKVTNEQMKVILADYLSLQEELTEMSRAQNIINEQQSIKYRSMNEKIYLIETNYKTLDFKVKEQNNYTNKEITTIKKDVLFKFFLTVFAILFSLAITFFITVIFKKKFKKADFLAESIKLDTRLSEVLENQLILMKRETVEREVPLRESKIDHSLPISVGLEIFRMSRRFENMDEEIKGLSSLKNALTRLEDEFNHQGYSMSDLTGQPLDDGLTVKVVNAIGREDLEPGTQIISRMITPQIFYKGVAVSHGEVEIEVSSKDMK